MLVELMKYILGDLLLRSDIIGLAETDPEHLPQQK